MNVNFILTGGELGPCEKRAILSAVVHDVPIVLWYLDEKNPPNLDGLGGVNLSVEKIEAPEWINGQWQAHIYDVLAYWVAYEHGGLVIGLDTISLRPVWDLLTHDMILSTDWPSNDPSIETNEAKLAYPYNNNLIAKRGSRIAKLLYDEAIRRIRYEQQSWGHTGPLMLTDFVKRYPAEIAGAPFPTLCGWAPGYLWRFYLGLETPKENVRLIHLCKTSFFSLYTGRYSDWAKENPYYAGEVERRTNANEHLLRCP